MYCNNETSAIFHVRLLNEIACILSMHCKITVFYDSKENTVLLNIKRNRKFTLKF